MGQSESSATLVDLLQYRAQHQPKQHAFTFLVDGEGDERNCTYEELDQQARAIGASLQALGVSNKNILLLYPPGPEFMPAFWGCVYAGAVPVPAYPPRANRNLLRLQSIIADAEAPLLLTTSAILSHIKPFLEQVPHFQELCCLATESLNESANDWTRPTINKVSLALIQYTSGSTGSPKGVMLSHENLLHNAFLVHKAVEHKPGDRYVSWLPIFHDMGFMAGLLQPLYGGFPVTLMSPVSFLQRPVRWLQAISRYQATTSGGPNFAYELCLRKITEEQRAGLDLSTWSVAFNGAEPVRPETLDRFAQTFATCGFRREAFYPCYGLAEATLMVSGGRKAAAPVIDTFDRKNLAGCGRTMFDQELRIVDPQSLKNRAEGEVGEIWVKGKSVARGYWGRDEETRETFQAYLKDSGEGPFLRTGDLGFMLDHELFVTGRIKDLIIIRGRNHYPQDIEASVELCHPDWPAGGVAAFSVEIAGEERLVVLREVDRRTENDPEKAVTAIRQAVADQHELQTYAVVLLKTKGIPKTSSGKIQRHACRDLFLAGKLDELYTNVLEDIVIESDGAETLTLQSLLATTVEERWSKLLGELQNRMARRLKVSVGDIDVQQPLTAYGLDSLTAIELRHECENEWNVVLPFEDLLNNGSVATLTTLILDRLPQSDAPVSSVVPTSTTNVAVTEFPLSYAQQALWFLYQLEPDNGAYNIASAFRLRSEIDVAALRRSFQTLVDRHPIFRTTYVMRDGQPRQRVHSQMQCYFAEHDAAEFSLDKLHERLEEEAFRSFNLSEEPVIKVNLFRRSPQDQILLLTFHHIAFDGWSFWLLLNELSVLYKSAHSGANVTLPPIGFQYVDYVGWQALMLSTPESERLSRYWQQELGAEFPVPNIPTSSSRSLAKTHEGDSYAFTLSKDLSRRLRQICSAERTTLYVLLLAAFQALLHKYTGQSEIVVGSPVAGRSQPEFESVIGCFMNPVGLRSTASGNHRFKDFMRQVREKVSKALDHQDYPSHLLSEQSRRARVANRADLFPVMFTMHKPQRWHDGNAAIADETGGRLKLGELELEIVKLKKRLVYSELELEITNCDDVVFGEFKYQTALFDPAMITRMAMNYKTLLESIAEDPQKRLSSLAMLSERERQELLFDWAHDSQFSVPPETINTLFNQQVQRTPDKATAVYQNTTLTYRELQQQANGLAALIDELRTR